MTYSVAQLLDRLRPDPWRAENGFSAELQVANSALYETNDSEAQEGIMDEWVLKHQPCLFGRIGARLRTITYCLINDGLLHQSDENISKAIQKDRARWKAKAYSGESSAFVIAVVSPTISMALPDSVMLQVAARICQLYLVADEILPDQIYTDQVDLEIPTGATGRGALTFDVGVNYFCAQADGRWWQDHRIPGGMAFSMNSVGHLVRSAILEQAMTTASNTVLRTNEEPFDSKVESLDKALMLAMRTISNASEAVSGKATKLVDADQAATRYHCPVALPRALASYDCRGYTGYYHTDVTLPSEYFLNDVSRPTALRERPLDFTYLFDDRLDNPAYARMGVGVRTRGKVDGEAATGAGGRKEEALRKRPRARGKETRRE